MTAEYPQYLWSIRSSSVSGPTPTAERALFESRYTSLSEEHQQLFLSFRTLAMHRVHDIVRTGQCPHWIRIDTRRIITHLHSLHTSGKKLQFDSPDDKMAYENLWYRIGFLLLEESIRKKDLQSAQEIRNSIRGKEWPDLSELISHLSELSKEHHLIIHQTNNVSAKHIMHDSPFFSDSWLSGTSLLSNLRTIEAACKTVDGEDTELNLIRHKWADSLVILCFPKKLLPPSSRPSLDAIDAALPDLFSHCGLPNQFIRWYWNGWRFIENPNFFM